MQQTRRDPAALAENLRRKRSGRVGRSWYIDETYIRVRGQWRYLYRAIDRDGALVDVMLRKRRDLAAAKAFFRSAKTETGVASDRVTIDRHDAYPRAIRAELSRRVQHRTSCFLNNRLEQDHREIGMTPSFLCSIQVSAKSQPGHTGRSYCRFIRSLLAPTRIDLHQVGIALTMLTGTMTWRNRLTREEKRGMAFEYQTPGGILHVLKAGCRWAIEFNGRRSAQWTSPDDVVQAVVHRRTGLTGWDRSHLFVPDDLLRWRPVGENL